MSSDILYQIALTKVPHIGKVHAKILAEYFGSAEAIFKTGKTKLENVEGIGSIRANSIKKFDAFDSVEKELSFIERYKIKTLFLTDKNYPQRLLYCYDSPTLLYYKGEADLNTSKIIAIIGTRNNTDYGKTITEKLIKELAEEKIMVVSGLAFGIDTIAHKAALKYGLPTVGVLAHGLDTIYPTDNTKLAKQMIANGGLLTEFFSGTKPDKYNFPVRNRIVAGMADATIVVETDIKGGSMITAELANNYNRDVFAFPGKTTDTRSKGCNYLIRNNKAALITCAQDILEIMHWSNVPGKKKKVQKAMFVELSAEEKMLVNLLSNNASVHIDEIYFSTQLSSGTIAAALLNLELQGIISSLPGKKYQLSD